MESRTTSKIVLIEWDDSASSNNSDWKPLEDIEEIIPLRCCSHGIVIREDSDCVTVLPHIGGLNNDDIKKIGLGELSIPKVAIRRMVELVEGKELLVREVQPQVASDVSNGQDDQPQSQ